LSNSGAEIFKGNCKVIIAELAERPRHLDLLRQQAGDDLHQHIGRGFGQRLLAALTPRFMQVGEEVFGEPVA
jgi:hypothetical protein